MATAPQPEDPATGPIDPTPATPTDPMPPTPTDPGVPMPGTAPTY